MKIVLTFLICLLFALNATAICPKKDVEVVFKRKYGRVSYNYKLSRKEFAKFSPTPVPLTVRGLTIGKLNVSYDASGHVFRYKNSYCAGVKKVNFFIGYDDFKVFIDKKYRQNTCEFKAVKRHEDEHVDIFNEGVRFFAPDIQKAIKKAVNEIRPEQVYSEDRAQQVFDKQARAIIKKIEPLLAHVNKKIIEKQGLIDTPEAYKKVQSQCKNW